MGGAAARGRLPSTRVSLAIEMSITDDVKGDLVVAMKAGEKRPRRHAADGALRAAEGRQGGLRRRARRAAARAQAPRRGRARVPRRRARASSPTPRPPRRGSSPPTCRPSSTTRRSGEIVARAVAQTGAQSAKDLGKRHERRDGRGRRPRRRQARLRAGASGARGRVRRQFEVTNDLAASLAGDHDAMLKALEQRLGLRVFLRGNLLTLDGESEALEAGAPRDRRARRARALRPPARRGDAERRDRRRSTPTARLRRCSTT